MSTIERTPGIAPGRLGPRDYAANFADIAPRYDAHEARVAADRCYFCHDAPCMTACPTTIDIPLFIRQIATGTPEAAAKTIFSQNILGGMCARVCPTEQLCEEVCVREVAEGKPVEIGRLQRYATDSLMAAGVHPFARAKATGKRVAIVGAGPAGLAAAHRLAMRGHDVVIHDARPKPGGLNEYGIASYKAPDGFAEAEVAWLLKIGGISVETGRALGQGLTLDRLKADHDAVLLAIGLRGVNALGAEGEGLANVLNAVDFIAELRQQPDRSKLPVGRDVVVIGGGMTAVDAAVQSKLLGAETVTIVYRRGQERMSASRDEQERAASVGVRIIHNAAPVKVHGMGRVAEIEFAYTEDGPKGLTLSGETFRLRADQVMKAIGQTLLGAPDGLVIEAARIAVTGAGRTSVPGVWAAGDCAAGGDDLTVTAVAEGRDAAEDIHASFRNPNDSSEEPSASGTTDRIVAHYATADLFDKIMAALTTGGVDTGTLKPEHLKPVDEFHIGGAAATAALLDQLTIGADTRVLDVGSGIGGSARFISARYGARVTGLDLTPEYVDTARRLTDAVGLTARFVQGSALDLPFEDESFDIVTLFHVGMNLADKGGLFRGVARVLTPGGAFAVYDVMRFGAHPAFPVPWASGPESSFLATPEEYLAAAEAVGLRLRTRRDRGDVAREFFAAMQKRLSAAGPPAAGLPILMGKDAPAKVANMVASVEAGDIAPVEMIFDKS